MATDKEYMEFIAGQLSEAGIITYRKMFGEYGIYCNGKIIGVICDDQLFLKITEAGRRICPDGEEAPPYEGAKPYLLIDDIDDRGFMTRLVQAVYEELPEPKPKKTKRKEGQENGKNGL